jgi:hypothetical protein
VALASEATVNVSPDKKSFTFSMSNTIDALVFR